MKTFKRITSTFLAIIMSFMLLGTNTVFAAEINTADNVNYNNSSNTTILPKSTSTLIANDTFYMSGSHTGATRTYNYTSMRFSCYVFDQNGKFTNTVLAVRLYDDTTGEMLEWQTDSTLGQTIPITYGHRYHFQYVVAYGTSDLKIIMSIYGIN